MPRHSDVQLVEEDIPLTHLTIISFYYMSDNTYYSFSQGEIWVDSKEYFHIFISFLTKTYLSDAHYIL